MTRLIALLLSLSLEYCAVAQNTITRKQTTVQRHGQEQVSSQNIVNSSKNREKQRYEFNKDNSQKNKNKTQLKRSSTTLSNTNPPQINGTVTSKPTTQSVSRKTRTLNVNDNDAQALGNALKKGDYIEVQKLANRGYAPSFVPLAEYYLNNKDYDDADYYAKKGKAAGQSGAQAIINTLENLGYYD